MQIAIKTKNHKLTDAEDDLIRKKLARLPRYLDQLSDAEVQIGTEHPHRGVDQQVVQLTVRANGTLLRAEEQGVDMATALDLAFDKIERRIARYKGRQQHKRGRTRLGTALVDDPAAGGDGADDEADAPAPVPIVRTKHFTVQPMDRAEAIEQMELLGHSFFVFWDADTKHMGVLYRRQDGSYGLLEPELA